MKSTEILHVFWPPIFWRGELPEFLESIYKIDTGSDHVAKFCGDRPRELGDYALNKKNKENITSKIEDLPYYRTGRSNKILHLFCFRSKRRMNLFILCCLCCRHFA